MSAAEACAGDVAAATASALHPIRSELAASSPTMHRAAIPTMILIVMIAVLCVRNDE